LARRTFNPNRRKKQLAGKTGVNPAQEAREVLAKHGFDKSAPIPVEKLAKAMGAQLRFSPLDDELSGMIFIKDGVPIIGVNALHHPNRQRFTIAHECAHLALHREHLSGAVHVDKQYPVSLNRDATSAEGSDTREIDANRFAAELLMPEHLLEKALADTPADLVDSQPLDDIARKFKVSRQTLEYRLKNYYLRK